MKKASLIISFTNLFPQLILAFEHPKGWAFSLNNPFYAGAAAFGSGFLENWYMAALPRGDLNLVDPRLYMKNREIMQLFYLSDSV